MTQATTSDRLAEKTPEASFLHVLQDEFNWAVEPDTDHNGCHGFRGRASVASVIPCRAVPRTKRNPRQGTEATLRMMEVTIGIPEALIGQPKAAFGGSEAAIRTVEAVVEPSAHFLAAAYTLADCRSLCNMFQTSEVSPAQ